MKYTVKKSVKRAEYLVRMYYNKNGGNVVDILTDLQHHCDAKGLSFHSCLVEASEFYRKEKRS